MKVIFERKQCIGCGTCAALCPKYWEMGEGDKARLKDAEVNPKTNNKELEVEEIGCNQEAADSCPVECIYIIKKSDAKT